MCLCGQEGRTLVQAPARETLFFVSSACDTNMVEEEQITLSLLDLPGTAWQALWSYLQHQDRLRLLQLCRGTRYRVLNGVQELGFCVCSEASLNPGSQALLRVALSRPQPLLKLSFVAAATAGDAHRGEPQADEGLHEGPATPVHGSALAASAGQLLEAVLQEAGGTASQQGYELDDDNVGQGLGGPHMGSGCTNGSMASHAHLWPAAASLRELVLQGVRISAQAAALLPQAFPHLASLHLNRCEQDTAALLSALHSCQHLASLALEEPQHTDPAGLWAAGLKQAEAAEADGRLVLKREVMWLEGREKEEARCAVAVGVLLGCLQHLTRLTLNMREGTSRGLNTLALPGLLSLHLHHQDVGEAQLDAILKGLPGLQHLAVQSFRNLFESRAQAPCAWRSLHILDTTLDVRTLAHLPLYSLTQPLLVGSNEDRVALLMLRYPSLEHSAALVEAASTNLARCKPGLAYAHQRMDKTIVNSYNQCLPLLRLLTFLPPSPSLALHMPEFGAALLGSLQQAGIAWGSSVRALSLYLGQVLPDFWSLALWEALPGLQELDLTDAAMHPAVTASGVLEWATSAPHPVSITGLSLGSTCDQAALEEQLAGMPGCKVVLVKDGW